MTTTAAIMTASLVACGIFELRRRRRIFRIISANECDAAQLGAMSELLTRLNAQSGDLAFTMDRAANITFREHRITLVLGSVCRPVPKIFGALSASARCLYAVADAREAEWMSQNPDAFDPVRVGVPLSVFGVKLSAFGNH